MDSLICALLVACWLVLVALVWRALPLPQPPLLDYSRRWAVLGVPWRGRVALGVRVEVRIISR
jgi:hypothetical protein